MKKFLVLALVAVMSVVCLAGCGSEKAADKDWAFECDMCGKESDGDKYTTTLNGADATICEDCFEALDEGFSDIIDEK